MKCKIEDTTERYRKIQGTGNVIDPLHEEGWVWIDLPLTCEEIPRQNFDDIREWLTGYRYDSEKKTIIQWEEEPIPPPVNEMQEMKDKLIELENRITELETNISSTTIKMTRGTNNG